LRFLRRTAGHLAAAVPLFLAAGLLTLAGASGPLFVSSAGAAALGSELDGPGAPSAFGVSVSGSPAADGLLRTDAALRGAAAERGLPEPRAGFAAHGIAAGGPAQPPADDRPGDQAAPDPEVPPGRFVNLLTVEGGIAALPDTVASAPAAPSTIGVTVTEQDAEALDVEAGDTIELYGPDRQTTVTVAAIVADIPRDDVPPEWQGMSSLLHYSIPPVVDPTYPPVPPPAVLADFEDMVAVLAALDVPPPEPGEQPPEWPEPGEVFVNANWRVPLTGAALTIEGARELTGPVADLDRELADPAGTLAPAVRWPARRPTGTFDFDRGPPLTDTMLADAVARAEQATSGLVGPVSALSIGGQALGLLAVGASTVVGGRRRLARARLWAARGVGPGRLGLRMAAMSLPALAGGVTAGWGLAVFLVDRLGPGGGMHQTAIGDTLWRSVLAGVLALLVVAVVGTVAAASAGRSSAAPRRLPPVAETTAAILAAVAAWQVRDSGRAVVVAPDGTVAIDLLALALPLLLLVALAGFGARLLRLLLRVAGRRRGPRAPSWYLASRRLRAVSPAVTGLVALAATAAGILVFAATISESATATIDEKAGLMVGADASLRLPRAEATRQALDLDELPGRKTYLVRAEEALLADRADVDVLAVDPGTFADVAHVPDGMTRAEVEGLLSRLAPSGDGPLPAALAGTSLPALPSGALAVEVTGYAFEVDVVERLVAFPGMVADRPLLVVADPDALSPEDPAMVARVASLTDPLMWVDGVLDLDHEAWVQAMWNAGISDHHTLVLASELRDDPTLEPLGWTFAYLRAQAVAVGLLGLLALLASFVTTQRQRALSTAMAARMRLGVGSRTAAQAVELVCLLGATLALGGGAGLLAARTVLDQYDPLPALALPPLLTVPVGVLLGAGVVAVLAGLGALAITAVTAARVDVAELLRRG
jgi:hypothetical protein